MTYQDRRDKDFLGMAAELIIAIRTDLKNGPVASVQLSTVASKLAQAYNQGYDQALIDGARR